MEFATYSDQPLLRGTTTSFRRGDVRKFAVFGFERCDVAPVQDDVAYHTPTGPFATRVVCENPARTLQGALTLGWTLSYQ
jgi:hypothetical protein